MRLFGKQIDLRWPLSVRAAAPILPPSLPGQAGAAEILPPFGTNPPVRPTAVAAGGLDERLIHNDPRELWYLALPVKLTPKQVMMILRSALGGDVWQQWQLLSLMMDTWPMLRKCSHELRQAVSRTKFKARPWLEQEGDEPDDDAKERADLVNRAMRSMAPAPFTDEKDFSGMVYDITDGVLNGLNMVELMWAENSAGELLPRASAWVHPRHFTFGNDGRLVLFDEMYNRLTFALAESPGQGINPNKFICAQFMSRSGSSLGGGLMRPLAWDWSAVVFNRDWMLDFAQKYGQPFLSASYVVGTPEAELKRLEQFMSSGGANRWAMFPNGTTFDVKPAQSLGPDNAQMAMMKLADDHCQILLLGQTATTAPTPGKLGNEDTHADVKREMVEGVANWVATQCLNQFARAILRLNYGDEEKCPVVEPDFTEAEDPSSAATRMQVVLAAGIPVHAEELYKTLGLTMPEPGDLVLKDGNLGHLSEPQDDVGAAPPPPPQFGPDGEPIAPEDEPAEDDVQGRSRRALRRVLAKASDSDLTELKTLLVKALQAPHPNGELQAVQVKINHINKRKVRR